MVSLFNLVRRLFPRKRSPECVLVPDGAPPQYGQVCGAAPPLSEKASLPSCEDSSLLNPNLHFTANEIEGHLVQQDTVFAAAVVELMLPRLKLGVWKEPVGWGHYSYTVEKKKQGGCHSEICQCNVATGWDSIIGFKAWEYANRYKQVAELVKHDLEVRGFNVDKIELYNHKCALKNCRGGVFVRWDVRLQGAAAE